MRIESPPLRRQGLATDLANKVKNMASGEGQPFKGARLNERTMHCCEAVKLLKGNPESSTLGRGPPEK